MRIALISDIHGNDVALTTVLADIAGQAPDQIICLGDLAALGPEPSAVIKRLQDAQIPCILGNHDAYVSGISPVRDYTAETRIVELVDWCESVLSAAEREFLRTLPSLLEIPLDNQRLLLCCHGSPRSNTDNILSETAASTLARFFSGFQFDVLACGHTHMQMMRRFRQHLIINAGSVGLPFEKSPPAGPPEILPWAEYVLLESLGNQLSVELRQVPIDCRAVRRAILNSQMPDPQDWAAYWQ